MSNETQQETWNATHAQLLKSVADAQARLLAAQNETCDRLEAQAKEIPKIKGLLENVVIAALSSVENRLIEAHNNHAALTGRVDAIGAVLAELLTVRRPGPRPTKRRRKR